MRTKIDEFDIPIAENSMIRTMSPYEITDAFESVIEQLSKQRIYMSWTVLPIIARLFSFNQFLHDLTVLSRNSLLGIDLFTYYISTLIDQYGVQKDIGGLLWINSPPQQLNLNLYKGEGPGTFELRNINFLSGLSESGFRDYVTSVESVSRPCFYLTPQGPIMLNFDIDLYNDYARSALPINHSMDDAIFVEFLADTMYSLQNVGVAKIVENLSEVQRH